MMSMLQFFLVKLGEEANEAGKEALKASYFGLHNIEPGQTMSNAERICAELDDVQAALIKIQELTGLQYRPNQLRIEQKKKKLEHYLGLSIALKLVDPNLSGIPVDPATVTHPGQIKDQS